MGKEGWRCFVRFGLIGAVNEEESEGKESEKEVN